MDSDLQFEFSKPSSNLGKNWYLENLIHHLLWKFKMEKITEEKITSSSMLWMASYFTANFSKTADDIVENKDQVILPRLETGIFW